VATLFFSARILSSSCSNRTAGVVSDVYMSDLSSGRACTWGRPIAYRTFEHEHEHEHEFEDDSVTSG
jgi:hypothetical protein